MGINLKITGYPPKQLRHLNIAASVEGFRQKLGGETAVFQYKPIGLFKFPSYLYVLFDNLPFTLFFSSEDAFLGKM